MLDVGEGGESIRIRAKQIWVQIPAVPADIYVILANLLNLYEPQFSQSVRGYQYYPVDDYEN